jgi:hypothetical protein
VIRQVKHVRNRAAFCALDMAVFFNAVVVAVRPVWHSEAEKLALVRKPVQQTKYGGTAYLSVFALYLLENRFGGRVRIQRLNRIPNDSFLYSLAFQNKSLLRVYPNKAESSTALAVFHRFFIEFA